MPLAPSSGGRPASQPSLGQEGWLPGTRPMLARHALRTIRGLVRALSLAFAACCYPPPAQGCGWLRTHAERLSDANLSPLYLCPPSPSLPPLLVPSLLLSRNYVASVAPSACVTRALRHQRAWRARAQLPLVQATARPVSNSSQPLLAGTAFLFPSLILFLFAFWILVVAACQLPSAPTSPSVHTSGQSKPWSPSPTTAGA